jgi:phosphoenolpyruvate carboxylase
MNKRDEHNTISQFQHLLGLSSFRITTELGTLHDEVVARADCDFIDKTIQITKGQDYKKLSDEEKRSILIHELIECRILWMDQRVKDKTESIIYEEREELVNELTKVLEKIK